MNSNRDHTEFNEKAESGNLSYDDKKQLFEEVFSEAGIKVPNRSQEKLEKMLQNAIFNLRSGKRGESSHVIAHSLLTCFSYLMGLDNQQHEKYLGEYQKAMKKHDNNCVLNKNYKAST